MTCRPRLLACMAVVALAAAAQGQSRSTPAFRITGTVVSASTGAPVPRATVAIAPVAQRSAIRTVRSDERGAFAFDNVAPGKYSLDAEAAGFPRQGFNQHEMYSSAIAVGAGDVSEGLVFRLQPGAVIGGTITDDFNEPVRNGQAILFRAGLQEGGYAVRRIAQAALDDQGTYQFGHLPAGKYYVAISAQPWYAQPASRHPRTGQMRTQSAAEDSQFTFGSPSRFTVPRSSDASLDVAYPVTFYAGATDSASATRIVLSSGDRITADLMLTAVPSAHLRLVLPPGESAQGTVPFLNQRVFGTEVPVTGQSSSYDAGTLEMNGVAPGHYVLHLQTFNNKSGHVRAEQVREVDVSGDAEVDTRQPSPTQKVTGTVLFEGVSSPPQRVFVALRNRKSREVIQGEVRPSGEFEILQNLSPGIYDVIVAGGMGFMTKTVVAAGAKVLGPAIEIGKPGPVQLQVIATHEFGRVDGVALAGDKPVPGAMIVLVPQQGMSPLWIRRDQSDSDGTFTLAQVVPGAYTVVAIKNGWDLPWASPGVLKPYLAQGQVVHVGANAKYNVKLRVQ